MQSSTTADLEAELAKTKAQLARLQERQDAQVMARAQLARLQERQDAQSNVAHQQRRSTTADILVDGNQTGHDQNLARMSSLSQGPNDSSFMGGVWGGIDREALLIEARRRHLVGPGAGDVNANGAFPSVVDRQTATSNVVHVNHHAEGRNLWSQLAPHNLQIERRNAPQATSDQQGTIAIAEYRHNLLLRHFGGVISASEASSGSMAAAGELFGRRSSSGVSASSGSVVAGAEASNGRCNNEDYHLTGHFFGQRASSGVSAAKPSNNMRDIEGLYSGIRAGQLYGQRASSGDMTAAGASNGRDSEVYYAAAGQLQRASGGTISASNGVSAAKPSNNMRDIEGLHSGQSLEALGGILASNGVAAAASFDPQGVISTPLRRWIEDESKREEDSSSVSTTNATYTRITFSIGPGPIGVDIAETADGRCFVKTKTDDISNPLQVGDLITSLNGEDLTSTAAGGGGLSEWVSRFQKASNDSERTLVVHRRLASPDVGGPLTVCPAEQIIRRKKYSLLRKTTVAYGMVELLRSAKVVSSCQRLLMMTGSSEESSAVDNFIVHMSRRAQAVAGSASPTQWDDITGVSMITPSISAQLSEPSFLAGIDDEYSKERMGRYLEVDIDPAFPMPQNIVCDSNDCHLFGVLLYELYSGTCPLPAESSNNGSGSVREAMSAYSPDEAEPARKRSTVRYDKRKGKSYSTLQMKHYAPLKELGFPSPICMLVQNLLDGNVYSSLDDARDDIHLLLSDPECYLFDVEDAVLEGGSCKLRINTGKVYGREKEEDAITEAFCRVSEGKNAAVFVGGYSGSGKSMLVQSLLARVNVAGGYVLMQKLDEMSKERPFLDVLFAFNRLCLLIRDKSSPEELIDLSTQFKRVFESDYSVLSRLLPNMNVLFPQLARPAVQDRINEQMMNLQNVCFILQRFMRIVSSKLKPVMLFLDDCQWAAKNSLELIQALLSDSRGRGSSCFLFVGNYRDNEIKQGHPLQTLMSNLKTCGVEATTIHLAGLKRDDLNKMISESLCILPRLCKHLTEVIYAKTKGNPYFTLEFLRSIVESRLLKYSLRERRWIWDLTKIYSESITDNVLFLLTSKMTSLPQDIQQCLKIVACFGIKVGEVIVGFLRSRYTDFVEWLNQAIDEEFIRKDNGAFKFVHDRVREAAYSLIPDSNKRQFHHDLGIVIYSASKGTDLVDDVIFQVVDQMNYNVSSIPLSMQVDVAELNFSAASRAMGFSDYQTAHSYLENALVLLPADHWTSNYELCLRLYFLKAKAVYSCGNIEKAYESLKSILERGRCIEDKLDAYYLYVTILHACQERDEAYTMCQEVLTLLSEAMPETVNPQELASMIRETGAQLKKIEGQDLLGMKQMEVVHRFKLRFHRLSVCVAFWKNPLIIPYHTCRMIRLTLENGVCQDAICGLIQHAAFLCQPWFAVPADVEEACRVGKAAMTLFERFDSSEIIPEVFYCYYGYVAVQKEPLQLCTDHLRKGFEVGVSAGDATVAFYNSIHLIRTALLGGEELSSILKEADYHLEVMTSFNIKISMPYINAYRETISTLIDKGQSTAPQTTESKTVIPSYEAEPNASNTVYAQRHNETLYFNKVLQSFWLGYSERTHHWSKKALEMKFFGRHNRFTIVFYATLNAFRGVKNRNGNGCQFTKVRLMYKDSIATLQCAAQLSPCQYNNKVFLLEAEHHSFERRYEEAQKLYAAAITSSKECVHEQGLACELAGLHYNKRGQNKLALENFQRAKRCYAKWGSQMKVESINKLIESEVESINKMIDF